MIIPAYNAGQTIGACLSALLQQSYPAHAFEVIVVNDGSQDGTAQAVREFQARPQDATALNSAPAIRLFSQANRGPAAARNLGAEQARGQYLLFTDADCTPDPDWVAQMVRPLAAGEAEGGMGKYQTSQTGLVARLVHLEFEQRYDRLGRFPLIDVAFTYAAAFRRDLFRQLGGFDATLFAVANNEDTEFSYRFAQAGHRLVFNPQAVVYHHQQDTLRGYLAEKFWRAYWRMVVYRRYPRKMLRDSYTSHSLKVQIALFYLGLPPLLGLLVFPSNLLAVAVLAIAALFLLTTLPASRFNSAFGLRLGLLTPGFLLLRAMTMGLGVIAGTLAFWDLLPFAPSVNQDKMEHQDLSV